MDELNKNQIILLTLLVSFVTSIATGIVTVTLLDQAPPGVTQTINRIVERTVEKVVPGETRVSTVIKEVPVIVTEEELIVKAINHGAKSFVRLINVDNEELVWGGGFVVTGGRVVALSKIFTLAGATTTTVIPLKLKIVLDDGRKILAENLSARHQDGSVVGLAEAASLLAVFKIMDDQANELSDLELVEDDAVIGQTVIALGADDRSGITAAVGIISGFLSSGMTPAPLLMTNAASSENDGGPLLNIKGQVVGLNDGIGLALPVSTIRAVLAALPE